MLPRYRVPVVEKKTKTGGKRRKTNEEYVLELAIKNPTVEAVEEYQNANTKIMHHCLIHDVYWNTTPNRVLSGSGCEQCRVDKYRSYKTKSHEQYVQEVYSISPHLDVIEKYIDAKTPIEHFCKKHNVNWFAKPSNILRGDGCKECGYEKIGNKLRKTQEEYEMEVFIVNSQIVVLEKYIDANTPILHRCLVDEYEWNARPAGILIGQGCPKCAGNIKKTHEQYVDEVYMANPNLEVKEEYVNINTPILHKCNIHNIEWKTSPASVLQGSGCELCAKEKLHNSNVMTHEEYVLRLSKITSSIEVLENYINSCTPILHRCLIDGHEWLSRPANILWGYGCPKCNLSKGEKQISQWLDSNNIIYEPQKKFYDCKDERCLPFDFYIQSKNMCIEYDGEQHFRPVDFFGGQEGFEITVKHDNIKNEYCKNNGITLLRIPYYKNVEEELNNFLFI